MKTSNARPAGRHGADTSAGYASAKLAGSRGIRVTGDVGPDVEPVTQIDFVRGALHDLGDGVVRVEIGGAGGAGGGTGSGSGVGSYAGVPIPMLNNSGSDLPAGSVVVVDESADDAVTTTTTPADIRIAGVLQADIVAGAIGPVLFNGFTGGIITTGALIRGDYFRTSTVAGAAEAVADRGAGTFAVCTSEADLGSFARASVVTLSDSAVTSLSIVLPAADPNRVLFLALWRDPTVTSTPTITGWTRIGSTSGFYYYYRVTTGSDTCTATWTGVSPATAVVLLLDATVDVTDIVEAFAYDATTAAAAITGLSASPRYALAAVQGDELTVAPTGWTLIRGGVVDYGSSATIVQQARNTTSTTLTFGAACTAGNVILVFAKLRPSSGPSGGVTAISGYTSLAQVEERGEQLGGLGVLAKTAAGGETTVVAGAGSTAGARRIWAIEIANVPIGDLEVVSATRQTTAAPWNLSAHAAAFGLAFDSFIVSHTEGGVDRTWTSGSVAPWTEEFDGAIDTNAFGDNGPWILEGTNSGTGASLTPTASATPPAGKTLGEWAGISVLARTGSGIAKGSLVGQYIASASGVTSPFTGSTDQYDALFAINLTEEPLPSALLYGPDLNHSGTPVTAPLILEDGTIAILEDGSAAMGETTYV